MSNFLAKKFVKNYENTTNPAVREGYGKLAGVVGILSNMLLCAGKIIVGVIAGSISIIADGINNLADASSSVITLVGFKLAAMPEDEDHPYGHARIEYISGIIVSVLIVVVGVELLKSSVEKILHPAPMDFSPTIIIVLVLAILIKIWQASFNISIGKKINSIALCATGADSRNDVIATSAVLISVIVGKLTHVNIDGYMGCVVSLFIMWSGIQLVRETSSPLLGEAPAEDLVSSIRDLVLSYDKVLGIHDLVVHNYGPGRVFASIHIEMDANENVMESHDVIDNIERDVSKSLHIMLTGHLDPICINDPVRVVVLPVVEQSIGKMDGVYNVHDFRTVSGPTHTNIIFDVLVAPDCTMTHSEIHRKIQAAVKALDSTYYVVINYDKPYVKAYLEDKKTEES